MVSPTTFVSTVAGHVRRAFWQRAQAAMLSVVLVVSAALPAGGAVAQEADQEREGVAAPGQTAPPDSTADPDFDPGGESGLPFDVGAPAGGGENDSGDGAPVDVEPVADPDALAVPLDDPAAIAPDALDGAGEPAPPAQLPAPAPAPPPAATPPQQANADQQTAGDKRNTTRTERGSARKRQRDRARRRPAVRVTIPAPVEAAAPAPVATTAVEPVQAAAPTPRDRARPGRRTYTVQSGDSLWRIASDLLGGGATNAEIVAESDRIYGLNRDRIGADPDVLAVGTVLRLR